MEFLPQSLAYERTRPALEAAAKWTGAPIPADPVPVHLYWKGRVTAKVMLSIKSLLATQPAGAVRPVLWFDAETPPDDAAGGALLAPLGDQIAIRLFEPEAELAGTPFARYLQLSAAAGAAARSDLFRLAVLYKYGGIYSDLDVVFLRPLHELTTRFPASMLLFQWSDRPYATNAFSYAPAGHPAFAELAHRLETTHSAHPRLLFPFNRPLEKTVVLPAPWFSPLWLFVDRVDTAEPPPFGTFASFFRQKVPAGPPFTPGTFFPGAFTYHWHNLYSEPERADSPAGRLNWAFDRILEERFGLKLQPGFTD